MAAINTLVRRPLTPQFLTGEPPQQSNSGANSFFFGVGHNLPWNGSISAAATRFDISTDFGDTTSTDNYNTSIDTLSGGAQFRSAAALECGGEHLLHR